METKPKIKIKKRYIVIAVILLVIIISKWDNPLSYINWDEKAENTAEDVIIYLQNGDSESIKSLFCNETIGNSKELDRQISDAIEFFEDRELIIDETLVGGGTSTGGGRFDYIRPSAHTYFRGNYTEYEMYVSSYLVNVNFPDKVGIMEIDIYRKTVSGEKKLLFKIGEYID
ncbi:MAG: DUF5104 domain-containing protein [Ruminococcus sp.]|nr:DUF5104 domain-containing protein [Ruminococcus sp.]